jgi:hypothetical protein
MRTGFWTRMGLAGFICVTVPGTSSMAANQANGPDVASGRASPDQFIAAFNLTSKDGFCFTWPPDSMRPAPYDTVLLVVESMPRVWNATRRDRRLIQLKARDHLLINGRPARSVPESAGDSQLRLPDSAEPFLAKLDHGRLRILLSLPAGLDLDASRNTVRIRLYRHAGRD